MGTDDVHDFFGLEEEDESDGSAGEPDERSEESDGSSEWPEFPSLDDGGSVTSADAARGETAESTTASSAEAVEGAADEFQVDAPTTPSDGSGEDADTASDSSGSPTMVSEEAAEDDVTGSEPATTPAGEVTEDDAGEDDGGEVEPAASSTSADGSVEDDAVEGETTDPTTTSSEQAVEDGAEESAPTAPTSPSQGTAENDTGESGTTATTTPPGEAAPEERDESEPERSTAAADGTTADDQGRAVSGGTTTSTDGAPIGGSTADGPATDRPTVDGHDELETASSDEPTSMASGTAGDAGVAATSSGSNRLPTGIDELDKAMGGGVPPGRLVVLVADPGVQSELIVDSVLAQRDTLFVTTDRPDWEVVKDIEPGLGSGEVVVRDHTPDSLLSGLDVLLDELGTSSNFVIDSVNELELLPRKRYRIFLSDVKRRLFDTGSVGLFTGVTVGHESARDLTLRRADVVWRLETRTTDREIENSLSVPKFRGGAALTETVKLELTDEVRVDPGWNDG